MCNLYRLNQPVAEVASIFKVAAPDGLNFATEVYPGYQGIVIAAGEVRAMTWGFPVVLKGKKGQLLKPKPVNNARFDKLNGFWRRWAADPQYRCLIPLSAYGEAVGAPRAMTRTWLSIKDTPVFAWAGLWRPSDEWGHCYTGVMTENAPELAHIHDRSPVLLDRENWQTWLTAPLAELYQFDRPYPAARVAVEATTEPWWKR
jgi:putative SOS response-associated peptidase YedK